MLLIVHNIYYIIKHTHMQIILFFRTVWKVVTFVIMIYVEFEQKILFYWCYDKNIENLSKTHIFSISEDRFK